MAKQREQLEWLEALFNHHVQRLSEHPRLEEQKKLLRGMAVLRENIDKMILSPLETNTSISPAPIESSPETPADHQSHALS